MNNEKQTCKACGGEGKFVTDTMASFGTGEREETRCNACCGFGVIYAERATTASAAPTTVEMPEPGHYAPYGREPSLYSERQMQAYGDARAEEARREGFAAGHAEGLVDGQAIVRNAAEGREIAAAQRTAGGEAECDTCNGSGVQCVGTSGSAEDGNAPLFEPCGACGYGEPVAEAAAQADDGPTMECAQCGVDRLKEPCPGMADECAMRADAHLLAPAAAPTAQPTPQAAVQNEANSPQTRMDASSKPLLAAQPTPPDDERAAFEAELAACGLAFTRDGDDYEEGSVSLRWYWWSAALRQPGALPDEARYTLDEIAEACMLAEVSDSRFEAIGIYLAAKQTNT